MSCLCKQPIALLAKSGTIFDQINDMLNLKEDLEPVEPHDLVLPGRGRQHECSFAPNQMQDVAQVDLAIFLHFDWLLAHRIFEVARY